eukprot:SAG11_NODE_32049_length_286_cov_95.925134_1_plen_47_part_01
MDHRLSTSSTCRRFAVVLCNQLPFLGVESVRGTPSVHMFDNGDVEKR